MNDLSSYASYTFYRTFGGGPEGGYIAGENSDGEEEVRAVERSWGTQFKVTEVPALKPQGLRLETKTEGGLTFVRQVGEWEQVYDKPHSFSHYCPPEDEESLCQGCKDNECCEGNEDPESKCPTWVAHLKEEQVLEPPEPSWTAEELARK